MPHGRRGITITLHLQSFPQRARRLADEADLQSVLGAISKVGELYRAIEGPAAIYYSAPEMQVLDDSGSLAITAWTCSRCNGVIEEIRILAKDGKTQSPPVRYAWHDHAPRTRRTQRAAAW